MDSAFFLFTSSISTAAVAGEVYSTTGSHEGITSQEMIEHDELYQEMVAQYGPLEEVSTKTSYIVTDYVVNEEQTLSTEKVQTYDELPLQYRMYSLTPFNINPGGEVKKTFSIIELTLRFEKTNNSNKYYVATIFRYLQLPAVTSKFGSIEGVVGLAFNPQLSIDGSSYGSYIYYGRARHDSPVEDVSQRLNVQANSTSGIGAKFRIPHLSAGVGNTYVYDYATYLSGLISCTAYKSNINDRYCSALGCYSISSTSITDVSFTVSCPPGISFTPGIVSDDYKLQDTLNLS